ncbi:MAG: glycosyltransferase family A protein [Bacteroidales bacterium]|nr:glycosyltransferase family A protein [Bacteroidales bacterium]
MEKAILDIGIAAYNHENFIVECVESVFKQKLDKPFRVIVIDDCSDDKTPDLLRELQCKYNFELILNEKNLGIIETAKILFSKINSDYLCWLDGDDYWTNSFKLQKQIDFLDKNLDYAGCFHDAEILQENNKDNVNIHRTEIEYKFYSQFNHYRAIIKPEDIIMRLIIPTASLVLRKDALKINLEGMNNPYSLAWKIQLESIKNSRFYYFNEIWSVYRDHPAGFSKQESMSHFKKSHIETLKSLLKDSYYRSFKKHIYESIIQEYIYFLNADESKHELNKKQKLAIINEIKKFRKLILKQEWNYFKSIIKQ